MAKDLASSTLRRRTDSPPRQTARNGASPRRAYAFELLESKLLPPQPRSGIVSREGLVSGLERAGAARIVIVSAGPGWGKTTLLAQWAAGSDRPFAWVDVDEGDNDPIVLLTYVAAALDRVAPLDADVFDALASPGTSVEGTLVPRLGAGLAAIDEPVVLAVDDLHLIDNPAALDAIAALARHVPEGSQLALATRGGSPLPLGALRARGLALEIGSADLRMDEADAGQLLGAAGAELPDEQVAELTAHTEGWSAGLYLAALSIRARPDKAVSVATFSGSDRLVSDYLHSELLAQVSAGEYRFLTRTAVLGRLSGSLCDAILGADGSAACLESLARSNLFVVPLDAIGEWYRYHHLFQELLRAELETAEPDLVARLLARAIDWCEANGQPEAAIGYAQQAGETDRVARLFEQCAPAIYQSGRVATAERWLAWLEAHGALERNALAAVLGALIAAAQGRTAGAERWAGIAELASSDSKLPDGSPSIDSWLALLGALRCREGVPGMRADAERAVRAFPRTNQFWPTALLLLGLSHQLSGELDQADDLFADVAEAGLALGAPEPSVVALSERSALAIGRGAWVAAEELVERATGVIRHSRMEAYPTSAFAYALAARLALHRRDSERAQEMIGRAQRLRPRLTYALPHLAAQTRLELARAYLMLADAGGARTLLREMEAIFRRLPDLGTLPAEVDELRASLKTVHADAPGASTLTEAELRLLPHLATHLSFREIGERLYISRHTVKSHAVAIYRKLNVTSRSAAVERAAELGLL